MRSDESLVTTYERKPCQHNYLEQLHYMLDAQQQQLRQGLQQFHHCRAADAAASLPNASLDF